MSFDDQMLRNKIEASKNPSKQYEYFQKHLTKAIELWIILVVLGVILVLLAGTTQTNTKKIGFTLIGIGGISLILSIALAVFMSSNPGAGPSMLATGNLTDIVLSKILLSENYKLIAFIVDIGFTLISLLASVYLVFYTTIIG